MRCRKSARLATQEPACKQLRDPSLADSAPQLKEGRARSRSPSSRHSRNGKPVKPSPHSRKDSRIPHTQHALPYSVSTLQHMHTLHAHACQRCLYSWDQCRKR